MKGVSPTVLWNLAPKFDQCLREAGTGTLKPRHHRRILVFCKRDGVARIWRKAFHRSSMSFSCSTFSPE
jgi:hypothetical protein